MCLAPEPDELLGHVVDFGVVTARVVGWIDQNCYHTAILIRGDPEPAAQALAAANARPAYWLEQAPTADVIVAELPRVAQELLRDTGVRVVRIWPWKTPNGSA